MWRVSDKEKKKPKKNSTFILAAKLCQYNAFEHAKGE
jgi:hypothetical protein